MTLLAVVLAVLILGAVAALVLVLMTAEREPDAGDEDDVPDPVDEPFNAARGFYVPSNHPTDCAGKCCWEIRLTELHDAFDWHRAECEMRKTK